MLQKFGQLHKAGQFCLPNAHSFADWCLGKELVAVQSPAHMWKLRSVLRVVWPKELNQLVAGVSEISGPSAFRVNQRNSDSRFKGHWAG